MAHHCGRCEWRYLIWVSYFITGIAPYRRISSKDLSHGEEKTKCDRHPSSSTVVWFTPIQTFRVMHIVRDRDGPLWRLPWQAWEGCAPRVSWLMASQSFLFRQTHQWCDAFSPVHSWLRRGKSNPVYCWQKSVIIHLYNRFNPYAVRVPYLERASWFRSD